MTDKSPPGSRLATIGTWLLAVPFLTSVGFGLGWITHGIAENQPNSPDHTLEITVPSGQTSEVGLLLAPIPGLPELTGQTSEAPDEAQHPTLHTTLHAFDEVDEWRDHVCHLGEDMKVLLERPESLVVRPRAGANATPSVATATALPTDMMMPGDDRFVCAVCLDRRTAAPGERVLHRLVVANEGESALHNITIVAQLSGGQTYVPGSTRGRSAPADEPIPIADDWLVDGVNIGQLDSRYAYALEFETIVSEAAVEGQVLTNAAWFSSNDTQLTVESTAPLVVRRAAAVPTPIRP